MQNLSRRKLAVRLSYALVLAQALHEAALPSAHDDDDEADDHEGHEDDEGHGPEDLEAHGEAGEEARERGGEGGRLQARPRDEEGRQGHLRAEELVRVARVHLQQEEQAFGGPHHQAGCVAQEDLPGGVARHVEDAGLRFEAPQLSALSWKRDAEPPDAPAMYSGRLATDAVGVGDRASSE